MKFRSMLVVSGLGLGVLLATSNVQAGDRDSFIKVCRGETAEVRASAAYQTNRALQMMAFSEGYRGEGCPALYSWLSSQKTFHLTLRGIEDLSPLSYFPQIESLGIDFNLVRDLAPIANLKKLRSLFAAGNEITDLSPLKGLDQLIFIDVGYNEIEDATPFNSLPQLMFVNLRNNHVSDVSNLNALPRVHALNLKGNPIPQDQIADLRSRMPTGVVEF
jgi:hypothetical protein